MGSGRSAQRAANRRAQRARQRDTPPGSAFEREVTARLAQMPAGTSAVIVSGQGVLLVPPGQHASVLRSAIAAGAEVTTLRDGAEVPFDFREAGGGEA